MPTKKQLSNLQPFQKGVSGNLKGRTKGRLDSRTIFNRFLNAPSEVKNEKGKDLGLNNLEAAIVKVIANAKDGDLASLREVLDRIEGKAIQTNIVTSTDNFENLNTEEKKSLLKIAAKKALE